MFRLSTHFFLVKFSWNWSNLRKSLWWKRNNWKIIRNMKCLCVLCFLWGFFSSFPSIPSMLIGFVSRKWTYTYNCNSNTNKTWIFWKNLTNDTQLGLFANIFSWNCESNEFGLHTHTHAYRQLNMVEVFPRIYAIKKDPIDEIIKENERERKKIDSVESTQFLCSIFSHSG